MIDCKTESWISNYLYISLITSKNSNISIFKKLNIYQFGLKKIYKGLTNNLLFNKVIVKYSFKYWIYITII